MTPAELDALLERLDMDSMSSPWFGTDISDNMQKAAAAIRELREQLAAQLQASRDNKDWFDALKTDYDALRALLRVAKCPNCDGSGSIPHQVGEGEWEQEQCQWCDERAAIDEARKP
jgi:hypothetical protein